MDVINHTGGVNPINSLLWLDSQPEEVQNSFLLTSLRIVNMNADQVDIIAMGVSILPRGSVLKRRIKAMLAERTRQLKKIPNQGQTQPRANPQITAATMRKNQMFALIQEIQKIGPRLAGIFLIVLLCLTN